MRAPPGLLLLLAAAALVAAGDPGGAAPVPTHLMKPALEGRWELIARDLGTGAKPKPVRPGEMAMEIAGRELTVVCDPGSAKEERIAGDLAHDAAARQLFVTRQRSAQRPALGSTAYGYALDGDTLTLALRLRADGTTAPVDPRSAGRFDSVYVLTRAKN